MSRTKSTKQPQHGPLCCHHRNNVYYFYKRKEDDSHLILIYHDTKRVTRFVFTATFVIVWKCSQIRVDSTSWKTICVTIIWVKHNNTKYIVHENLTLVKGSKAFWPFVAACFRESRVFFWIVDFNWKCVKNNFKVFTRRWRDVSTFLKKIYCQYSKLTLTLPMGMLHLLHCIHLIHFFKLHNVYFKLALSQPASTSQCCWHLVHLVIIQWHNVWGNKNLPFCLY